MSEYSQEDYFR